MKIILNADFNNDKKDELLLVVWKRGSFGESKPFWILENDNSFSDHLFIYKYENDAFKPFWHSSKLERPICNITVSYENKNLGLGVWEGEYRHNSYLCQEQKETAWEWNGWGFTRVE